MGVVLRGGTTRKAGLMGRRARDPLLPNSGRKGRRSRTWSSQEGLTAKIAHTATTRMLAATMNLRRIFFPRRFGAEA